MTLYKVLAEDGRCVYGGSGYWPLPEEEESVADVAGRLSYGTNGYHMVTFDSLPEWIDPRYTVFEAEATEDQIQLGGVVVSRSGKLLRKVNGLDGTFYWNLLNTFIGMVSKVVLSTEDHIEVNNFLLKVDDDMSKGVQEFVRFPDITLNDRMKLIMSRVASAPYDVSYMAECLYGLKMSYPYKVIFGSAWSALGYKVGWSSAEKSDAYQQMLSYLKVAMK